MVPEVLLLDSEPEQNYNELQTRPIASGVMIVGRGEVVGSGDSGEKTGEEGFTGLAGKLLNNAGVKSGRESLFHTDKGIRFMLVPRSAKAKHSAFPGKSQGMRNLPRSPSFLGNFFRRTAEQCLGALTGEITGLLVGQLTGSEVRIGDLDWTTGGWTSLMLPLLKNPPSRHLMFEEPELCKQELGKLKVEKPRVDKQEREENQEVKFDLTSSKDDS
nr:hypothetical protein [Tanacetum cinerariifolium]